MRAASRPPSHTTRTWEGAVMAMTFWRALMKPKRALVGVPSGAFRERMAWKDR